MKNKYCHSYMFYIFHSNLLLKLRIPHYNKFILLITFYNFHFQIKSLQCNKNYNSEELSPLVYKSNYIMLRRLGACDGARNKRN